MRHETFPSAVTAALRMRGGFAAAARAALLALAAALGSQQAVFAAQSLPDFASYVSREEAVVVTITTVSRWRPVMGDDDGEDALEQDGGVAPVRERDRGKGFEQASTRGQSSGIVISSDGYILTSAHVVTDIEAASVSLADGREFKGRVVGLDVRSDVALMKIDATNLTAARIGDPKRLAIGDWVAAVGAPFGFNATVTAGIVSARRFFPGGLGVAYIQSDVATNPGSSGGPLFNLAGEVVGMSSMVATFSGGYMGVSFALPIDVALDVAERLRTQGGVVRGHLGARVQQVSSGLARAFGRDDTAGALVTRVDRGSGAERAGLRTGDIILGVGTFQTMSFPELQQAVAATPPGTLLAVTLWRARATRQMTLEISALENNAPPISPEEVHGDRLGLVLAETAVTAGLDPSAGARIEVRESHGAALRAGIAAGDVIVAVNDQQTDRLSSYQEALARVSADPYVAVLVMRRGRFQYFALAP